MPNMQGKDSKHEQPRLEMGLPKNSRTALHSSISHLQGDSVFHSRRHGLIHLRCHLAKNSHSTLIKAIADTRCRTVPNYVDPSTVPAFRFGSFVQLISPGQDLMPQLSMPLSRLQCQRKKPLTQAHGCFGEHPVIAAQFALKFLDAFLVLA